MTSSSFYISTPIYYVNDVPHLGHAYTTIVADALARYNRSRNKKVFFLTGTDEHGQKIERAAQKLKESPQILADQVFIRFKETWKNLNISNDDFIRTTEPRHIKVVQAIWKRMMDAGDIYLGDYDGLYCVGCEEYYTEGQAEDGGCPVHGTKLERLKQPSYFFRMSRYQDRLLQHFEKYPDFVRPEIRRNEIVSFIKSGLRDLSISRATFRWGIEVPDDPKHVMYVWVDALTNYISGLGGFENDNERYRTFWPADVHLIGKDILRFHAVYWPTMLMAAGLPLPKCVFAHGWWTINGQKMSKSLRNVVEPNMIARDVGRDALRYFVLRETPLGNDGDFSHKALIHRINAELANDLGNLLSRAVTIAVKFCEGKVPAFAKEQEESLAGSNLIPVHQEFINIALRAKQNAERHYDNYDLSRALESIWELVRGANKYIDSTIPFKLAKDPTRKREVEIIVANFLEALRWIALLVQPVMPEAAAAILKQIGLEAVPSGHPLQNWPTQWGELPEGLELHPGSALFPRIDEDRATKLFEKWKSVAQTEESKTMEPPTNTTEKTEASQPIISYDEFARLDLRVAKIIEASRIEGANRLLKLLVDIGTEQRQVVAGIAEAYTPEELIGRKVIFLANLKPAKIRGVQSEGMILAAGGAQVVALSALDREAEPGIKVR